jgi:hypothetical protein
MGRPRARWFNRHWEKSRREAKAGVKSKRKEGTGGSPFIYLCKVETMLEEEEEEEEEVEGGRRRREEEKNERGGGGEERENGCGTFGTEV